MGPQPIDPDAGAVVSGTVVTQGGHGAPAVRFERDGAVGTITLDRAPGLNAINDAMRIGMVSACQAAIEDPGVRVVVIRAEGDRAFCVGADIKETRSEMSLAESRIPPADRDYTTAIAGAPKPVICAINGFCLGAGLEIALACDFRIASADASFGLPEVNLGLIPGAGGTQRLPRVIGPARALDMMMTGQRIGVDEALRIGLVTRVVADKAALDAAALALARDLAAKPPLALLYLKEAVRAGIDGSLPAGLSRERDLFTILRGTEDSKEAALAFKDKRAPVFHGR
jgi:enoyl-CoA hydratase/carnithine racemase